MTTSQQTDNNKTIVILGASTNPDRYAWKAQQLLVENHYPIIPVSIKYPVIGGISAYKALTQVPQHIHTLTVYLNPAHLANYVEQIVAVKPERVILNPGSEDPAIVQRLKEAGIEVEAACTLVLLRTGQF